MATSTAVNRWLSIRLYGLVTSTLFRPGTAPATMRARFERFGRTSREAMRSRFPKLVFEDHRIGSLPMESVCAVESPRCTILHLHGGAFVMGSPQSYRERAKRLSYQCHAEVFVPDYRLAPEHPYPAALDDSLAAFQHMTVLRRGMPAFLTGDSAGGGLALSLLVRLRDADAVMPSGAVLLSPWTDLTACGSSIEANRRNDLWLTRAHLDQWARHYVGNADPAGPEISPVFADLSRLPPLLLLAGEHEVLLDDAVRVGRKAALAGTPARVLVGRGMQHDWPLTLPWLQESRLAWREIRRFLEECRGAVEEAVPGGNPCPIGHEGHVRSDTRGFRRAALSSTFPAWTGGGTWRPDEHERRFR